MNLGLNALIKATPDSINTFTGSEYPLPINQALFGEIPNVNQLKQAAIKLSSIDLVKDTQSTSDKDIEKILHLAMALSELVEASTENKTEYFITDTRFRRQTFNVKRSPGWALILGDENQSDLINRLKDKNFIIYSTFPHPNAIFLGNRSTSSIYFLQNQVRYAMIYGQIDQGDPHEMGHFLEADGPGILIVHGNLSEVESLLVLSYMIMGTPTIVPSTFQFPYGNPHIADSLDDILSVCMQFPNLRILEFEGSTIQLPTYCDSANIREEFNVEKTLGITPLSFLAVQQANADDGIELIGELNEHLGILVELTYEGMNDIAAEFLENIVATLPNYIKGMTTYIYPDYNRGATTAVSDGFQLAVAKDADITAQMVAETIHAGIKKRYPRLNNVKVSIISDEAKLAQMKPAIDEYKLNRVKIIENTTEETLNQLYSCVSCQPFAREHACVITPERPPMCRKDWRLMLVGAYLNPRKVPDPLSRQSLRKSPNIFGVLEKGKLLDPIKGEWSGVNTGIALETRGKIQKVQLHSITGGSPHSSCGCFGYLAFYMPEIDGIGIMKKNYKGQAPNGMTWDLLANRAGGKQEPNITGLSLGYLKSPKFLQGDGGFRRVVWMDHKTHSELNNIIPPQIRIATDNDVSNMDQLRNFIKSTSI